MRPPTLAGDGPRLVVATLLATLAAVLATTAATHEIGGTDRSFVANAVGPDLFPFAYLGAKHMVSGYDHLLFLLGVVFYLTRLRDILLYVSLFSVGHSLTLLAGVYLELTVNARLVDAAIGISVIYKAFDNLDGFRTLAWVQPDGRGAVFAFGLVHGLGLATTLQALELNSEGLLANLMAFNLGVELGQTIALVVILLGLAVLQRRFTSVRSTFGVAVNLLLITAGVVLVGQHIAHFIAD